MKKFKKLAFLPLALLMGISSCTTPETPKEDDPGQTEEEKPDNPNEPETPEDPEEPEKPEEEKIDSLSSLIKNIDKFEDYSIEVTGSVNNSYQGKVDIKKTIDFSENAYVYKEYIGNEYLSSGLINKDGYVGAFNANNGRIEPIGIKDKESSDYHETLIHLGDIIDTPFLTYPNNAYYFDFTMYEDGTYVNQYDYINFTILANVLNLGTYQQMINSCTLTYDEEYSSLVVDMKGTTSMSVGGRPVISLSATIDFDTDATLEIENHFKDYTFVEPVVNEEVKGMIEKIETGFMVENIEMSATDGSTLSGNVYSNKDYIVFDYSDKIADKIQGYAEKNGALYSVTPTVTGPNFEKVFTKNDLAQVNEEMGTNFSAIDLGKVMFAQSIGLFVPEATTALNAPFLYKNNGGGVYMAGDSANLYGLRNDSDSYFSVSASQGLVPAGYYLQYADTQKSKINFGYYCYGNTNNKATAYSGKLITMSSFGSRNKTMDILLSRL